MFEVMLGDTIYTAVAEIGDRWIDGNSGHDVTGGIRLGERVAVDYHGGRHPYFYHRRDGHIWQLQPGANTQVWFCDCAVQDVFFKCAMRGK